MAQNGFSLDATQLVNGLANFGNKAQAAVEIYAETGAKKMESYAKKNAPWTDQTGHARQRLHGYVEKLPSQDKMRIYIAHGVEYGKYLEHAHEQKYAICEPTVMVEGKKVVDGFNRLLERIK